MERVLPRPVKAQYFKDLPEEGKSLPGSFTYYERDGNVVGMIYTCPCGCGVQGSLAFRPYTQGKSSWAWDGNVEVPTLIPSINHRGHWHGYLTTGYFKQP